MIIHVRRRHIVKGNLRNCPLMRAFLDATGERAIVGYAGVSSNLGFFQLPRSARRFIARFDAGKPVKPFAFVLK